MTVEVVKQHNVYLIVEFDSKIPLGTANGKDRLIAYLNRNKLAVGNLQDLPIEIQGELIYENQTKRRTQ